MASRAVKFVWKIAKPPEEQMVRDLMAAAYRLATQEHPYVTTILIRTYIHGTTYQDGKWVKDDPHITISTKTGLQESGGIHESCHGYTKSMDDYTLIRTAPDKYTKSDNTLDIKGKPIWPNDLPSEVVMYQGAQGGTSGVYAASFTKTGGMQYEL
ncbi:MAG: hypothetical protein L6R41_008438 [Letrouitia leprolyta]|nr:MAG: hypothetical protein L6R41_008438 [Letrouitia leprolyta]